MAQAHTVLVVDDDSRILDATARLLGRFPDNCVVVGCAANGRAAVDSYFKLRPDIVLMDLEMPVVSGFDATVAILRRDRKARILVVSAHSGLEWVVPALRAGAAGYLIKGADPDHMLWAMDAAMNDEMPVDPGLVRALVHVIPASPARPDFLTAREREVLNLLAQGLTNDDIATTCLVSVGTVKATLASLRDKLGAVNRSHIVAQAARLGLLSHRS